MFALIRNAHARHASRTAARTKVGRAAQRGMTLLEIMIVLAILALVMGLVVGPRVMKMFGQSKVQIARIAVKKYADEAFPSWQMAHTGQQCPASIMDLNEFMNSNDPKDPWGDDYKLYCGQQLPPGAHGVAVLSYGEDQKEGTPDDIKSWE